MDEVKIEKLYTRKRYVIKSKKLKQVLGITGKERVVDMGMWEGMSPAMEEQRRDPDEFESWYFETEDVQE